MRIEHLYRYPVKGLTQESLDEIDLTQGAIFPWDRAFALAQGDAPFDPAQPKFLAKRNFMCLAVTAHIAQLKSRFDPAQQLLCISAQDRPTIAENPFTAAGAMAIAQFLAAILGPHARGMPRFHYVPGHNFADDAEPVISLINQASLDDFTARIGNAREALRFRPNIILSGAAPWAELSWLGREFQLGQARVRILRSIPRCTAPEVNPATAERDASPVQELRGLYGHHHMGVYLTVVEGGRISVGDAMEAL